MNDGLDDHPDLAGLGWSKREERRALRRARSPRSGFFRRHRVKVISIGSLVVLITAGALVISGIDRSATANAAVDLEHPFATTPAADWREGAAGIVAPGPVAVGAHTAEDVAGAYAAVQQLLITARLDERVIVAHDREPVRQLLDPSYPDDSGIITRISDDFRLSPAQPRVRGKMAADLDPQGQLVIHTDYVVAYAFAADEPDRLVNAWDVVAVERLAMDIIVTAEDLWPISEERYAYAMACTAYGDGVLAPSYSERVTTDEQAGDDEGMFDPNLPMPTGSTCPA